MSIERHDLVRMVQEILEESTTDPVENVRLVGQALVDISAVLKGASVVEAKAVVKAVAIMNGIDLT